MSVHRYLWSGLLIVLSCVIASPASAADKPAGGDPGSFLESVRTARLVAAGTLAEYRLGGYIVSSAGSHANIMVQVDWGAIHFGVRPGNKRIHRRIPVKRGTKPKLRFKKGDKVLVSWQTSVRDGVVIVPYSKDIERKAVRAIALRSEALAKKHGAKKAARIERVLGVLGGLSQPTPQANVAAVDQLVAMKDPALPVLQELRKQVTAATDKAILEEAIFCLKWKLNPDKLIREWIRKNVRGFQGRPVQLRRSPQRSKDPAVIAVFGDTYVLCELRFMQFPVARALPAPLKANNLFAIKLKDKTIGHITGVEGLEKFFLTNAKATAGNETRLKTMATAWLKLSTVLTTDGFFGFEVDAKGIGVAKDGGWKVVAKAIVRRGGRGHIEARLRFDVEGRLLGVKQDKKLVSGMRPICQARKLLDSDPVVRGMAAQGLRVMGVFAREYLTEQRAKASPELQRAIDRIWLEILEDERRLGP